MSVIWMPNSYVAGLARRSMQNLRDVGWVKATALPHSPRTLKNLVSKGWVEFRRDEDGVYYRITDQGVAARMAPVPI